MRIPGFTSVMRPVHVSCLSEWRRRQITKLFYKQKKNCMKKIMLLMAAALVSLSACSKSANEPAVKNQDDEVVESINLTIEGERENVSVLDENGRALNLKGSVEGSNITGITLGDGKVEGIIYVYSVGNSAGAVEKKGFARRVTFDVHNNKVSYRGELKTGRLRRGQLPYLKMDVYIGGNIGRTTIDDESAYPHGGGVQYLSSKEAVLTKDGMDLSVHNPIFYSKGLGMTVGKTGQVQDYYSTGHKFKLYGEFVSLRFRMTNGASTKARFNGLLVRGFGIGGVSLDEPTSSNGYTPTMTASLPSSTNATGTFISFPDNKTYYINGDGHAPYEDQAHPNVKSDVAYTIYLFTPAEPRGGVRMGFSKTPNIFMNGTGDNANNLPGYWGESTQDPYHSTSKNYGKFHNLVLLLRRK